MAPPQLDWGEQIVVITGGIYLFHDLNGREFNYL